jgi:CheY-like chemotaxis protein
MIGTPKHMVMIVDDNEDIRVALQELLESEGYEIAAAENGEEALRLLTADHCTPCMILLDYNMPVMDGPTFRKRQQANPTLADIPVILYSGGDDIRRRAHALDVMHVFQKPLNLNALVDLVRRYC